MKEETNSQSADNPTVSIKEKAVVNENTAGLLILQWLTYAFWGWFLLAVAWNTAILSFFILEPSAELSGVIPYSLASLFVLLPIASIVDFLYQKKGEPVKKTGGASAIMAIHAVLFALLGIAAFITAVFVVISLLTSTDLSHTGRYVAIITSLVMAILYGLALGRVLNPKTIKKPAKIYTFIMIGFGALLFIGIIVGPLVRDMTTKNDRRIVSALPIVSNGVDEYVRINKELPTDLQKIDVDDSTKSLIDEKLITIESLNRTTQPIDSSARSVRTSYLYYQLCARYTTELTDTGQSYYTGSSPYEADDDNSGIKLDQLYDISSHSKGEVCYKQRSSYSVPSHVKPLDSGTIEPDKDSADR